ncbi:MAG: hypothetical protein M3Q53_03385 [Actinomycetota bacterium]|nr:hypothetical protein [Actinomycetota bacterium]
MRRTEARGEAARVAGFRSRDEAQEVIDRTFLAVENDESLGPMLQAAALREELRLSDLDLTVAIGASDGDRCLDWSFAQPPPFEPRISLTMNSQVANSILQGAESIGVAIARRRMRIEGSAGAALVHLPALRLIRRPYADLIERDYPHLLIR